MIGIEEVAAPGEKSVDGGAPVLGPVRKVLGNGGVLSGEQKLAGDGQPGTAPEHRQRQHHRGGRRGVPAGDEADGPLPDAPPETLLTAVGRHQRGLGSQIQGVALQALVAEGQMLGDLQPAELVHGGVFRQRPEGFVRQVAVFIK